MSVLRLVVLLAACCVGVASAAASDSFDALVKSAREFERVKSVHMHREGGTTAEVDYVAPDRYHVTTGNTEIIWIGKIQYIRQQGPWSAQQTEAQPPFDRNAIEDAIGGLQKATIVELGDAKLGAIETHRYEVTTPDKATSTVWIGAADGLTYRIENRKPDGTFDSALVYSNYNVPVKIDAPPGVNLETPLPQPLDFPKR